MKQRGKKILFLFFLLFVIVLLVFASSQEQKKANEEVYKQLGKNGETNVIVKIKEKDGWFGEEKEKLIGIKITEEELEKLEKDKRVEKIEFSPQIRAFLQDSVPMINATSAWAVQANGINITGIDETVCIIDTGINFSHPALIGKNKTCIIDCYNKDCIENCSIGDDCGHGTHIAGVIAASSAINGVAINASLIGLKILDENGWGHPTNATINLMDAVNWCINNKDNYNISVISMSLGTENLYSEYCDSDYESTITRVINNATLYNISVIVATGNGGSTTSIAAPACIENSTAVGVITKDDSSFGYNRNAITDLIAPGYSINSTRGYFGNCLDGCNCAGNYLICSGTSMATPHVAGAFALVHQYLKLQDGHEPKPYEIENILKGSAKVINDSAGSGLNFYRIDVYSALISADTSSPEVSLVYPPNNVENSSRNQTFKCNATDSLGLKNMTLQIWNSSSLYYENTTEATGNFLEREWNLALDYNSYYWNCLAYDLGDNPSYAEANFTLNITDRIKMIVIGVDGFQYSHYVTLLRAGILGNFTRLMANGGFNTTLNITGHAQTATAPGNSELQSGLNETLSGISDNTCNNPLPQGNATFERIKAFNSSIATGLIYGKTTCYIPNGVLGNSLDAIDWYQNRTTYNSTNWTDGTACDDSRNVSAKAAEFIGNYSNASFYLFVYFGVPDCSGHAAGDNSINYNNSFINVDAGLGVLLDAIEANGLEDVVQIIVSADHGWNENSNGHSTVDENTTVIPIATNNITLIQATTSDGVREQCEIAPTTLDYLGLNESDYQEIVDNGCESMIYHDIYPPELTITSPSSTTYTSSSIIFNVSLDENGYCEYSLNNGTSNNTMNSLNDSNWYSTSTLSNGAYTVIFYCNDTMDNKNYSEEFSFTVAVSSSGIPSGGGGGGVSVVIYHPATEQMEQGYSKELKKGDSIIFSIKEGGKEEEYKLTIKSILEDAVVFLIESASFEKSIASGSTEKLDLNGDGIYDLSIKVNSIGNGRANLTIGSLSGQGSAPLNTTEETKEEETYEEKEDKLGQTIEKNINAVQYILIVIAALIIIIILVILLQITRGKNEKAKAKSQRKEALSPVKGRRLQ